MNIRILFSLGLILCARALSAGSVEVIAKNGQGAPVSDAVVYATISGNAARPAKKQAIIDQRGQQFAPYVTALEVGTAVIFPNSDNIRHHVYSLSPAKKFELPLYAGVPAQPVIFDKVGFVTLGCNIHDWMVAYVAVLPTPYFQVTGKDGRAALRDLPAARYTVEVWHPSLRGSPDRSAQSVELGTHPAPPLAFALDLKPDFRANRAPDLSTGGYR
jgi:plastocyanin